MAKMYTCDECHGTFEAGWTEEEARAEAEALFGKAIMETNPAVVCDPCWRKIMGLSDAG